MMTTEDVELLRKPFAVSEHEFHPYFKFCYVKELAISERIESVDPSWEFKLIGAPYERQGEGGTHYVCVSASMTVKGITRQNIGMSETYNTIKKTGEIQDKEAEKNSVTDALKRCARMFGVGRYLTQISQNDKVTDEKSLERWMIATKLISGAINEPQKREPLPKQRKNPNPPQKDIGVIPAGTRKQVLLYGVKARATQNGGWEYTLITTRDENNDFQKIIQYERGVFKGKGYVTGQDWQSDGYSEVFNPPINCWLVMTDKGQWIIEADTFPPFDPQWADLAPAELPNMPMPVPQFDGDIAF